MNLISVPLIHIASTLDVLQRAGLDNKECVVLWLGKPDDKLVEIEEVFVPIQHAEEDFFRIPREGMASVLDHLRQTRLMIAAQVHSHPTLAFHSFADDQWAILRHIGALSLVVPYFAQRTTAHTFIQDVAVFEMTEGNQWVEVSSEEINNRYQITA